MSELVTNTLEKSLILTLLQISAFCISQDAIIEPNTHIRLWTAQDGRHTEIKAAHIESGVFIDELTHVYNGVSVGKDAHLHFRSTIKEQSQIGHRAVVGTGSTLEKGVDVAPGSEVGNFTIIATDSVVGWCTEVGPQSYVGPGINVRGRVGPHAVIQSII